MKKEAAYFDSSIVLSFILGDTLGEKGLRLWDCFPQRVTSILLHAECTQIINRDESPFASTRQNQLTEILSSINIVSLDSEIIEIIRSEKKLKKVRSLDAIHLATSIFIQSKLKSPLVFCTFDQKMAKIADEIGFLVEGL